MNILTMSGMLIVLAANITKHLIDKDCRIPNSVYIIAYALAIVLLTAGLIIGFKNRL